MDKTSAKYRILDIIRVIIMITAIVELALSQFVIKITRLSSAELTGISYFAFIIFGLVTLFSVSKIKESYGARIFAFIMNIVTFVSALWYLFLMFSDDMFFRNLYYNLNRQTGDYELLSTGGLISASIPLAIVILGMAVYCLCAIAIVIVSFTPSGKKQN